MATRKPKAPIEQAPDDSSTNNEPEEKPRVSERAKPSGPIRVVLTTQEKSAYDMAGDTPDDLRQIESVIRLVLGAQHISRKMIDELAPMLAESAMAARLKIKEATRFVIDVRDP